MMHELPCLLCRGLMMLDRFSVSISRWSSELVGGLFIDSVMVDCSFAVDSVWVACVFSAP